MGQRPNTARRAKPSAYGLTVAALALVLALAACSSGNSDGATIQSGAADPPPSAPVAATPYYVEFRTRPYFSITHIFIVYGAQDPAGHPLEWKTVGFYPKGGVLGPYIGIVGIAGMVGQEDYYAKLPSSNTYRRNLTAEEYQRLTNYIEAERGKSMVYNLFFNNCNDFVAGAAAAIGLKVPMFGAVPPPLFITLLKEMNT